MFDQISIIGCGLIGSSIFKVLKKVGSIKKIITYDNDKSVNEIIQKDKLSDEIFKSVYYFLKKPNLISKQKEEIKKTLETLTSPSSSSEEASNIILSYIS